MNLFRENKPPLPKIWCGGKPITTKIWCGGKEKGVALLIVFFIMGISLSVFLGVSAILFSEIKVIRGMGYSVKAFYAADTGIEELLYLDKKKIPTDGTRGFCDICNSCPLFDCQSCSASIDCDPIDCTECQISYYTEINGRRYDINSAITPIEESFKSYGSYQGTTRAIELELNIGY